LTIKIVVLEALRNDKQTNGLEEAEFGFRKAVEFGDHELDGCFGLIFFNSCEFESAIQTLLQASEYYPEENEIEYRLADYTL
jgi:hypothetical protein